MSKTPALYHCPGCKSEGFPPSILPDQCEFCDGTEGGNPPDPMEVPMNAKYFGGPLDGKTQPLTDQDTIPLFIQAQGHQGMYRLALRLSEKFTPGYEWRGPSGEQK